MYKNLPILFFNFYHSGDIFNSKAFVKEIIDSLNVCAFYAHNAHFKVLCDLNVQQFKLQEIFPSIVNEKILVTQEFVLVNTWIGAYFTKESSCTLNFSYNMYKDIYSNLNILYENNLILNSNPIEYFPSINFDKVNVNSINDYLKEDFNKKVLICNGPALSNQSLRYNGNMQNIILDLASTYKDITFICTENSFNCSLKNVLFTDDLTKRTDCDLNEISYLSKFCDVVVGRSSGPFSFSLTKDNMLNLNKTFICFGDKITDCFQYGTSTNSKFIFEQFSSEENLLSIIKNTIHA
jgi:hypothetical protein